MTSRSGGWRVLVLTATLAVAGAMTGCAAATPSEAGTAARGRPHGGEWFVETGCTACHTVSVYGLTNPAARAPDLSLAVEDVPSRFGRSVEDFLRAPTGTMAMVLAGSIVLTDADRRAAAAELHRAYALHQEQRGRIMPAPSH